MTCSARFCAMVCDPRRSRWKRRRRLDPRCRGPQSRAGTQKATLLCSNWIAELDTNAEVCSERARGGSPSRFLLPLKGRRQDLESMRMDDDFAESPFYVRQEALRREKEVKLSTEKANTLRYEKKMGASGPKMSFKSRKITKNQPRLVPSLSGIISERMAEREQLILAHVTEITTPRRYGHGTPRSTSRVDKYADGLAWQERQRENQERLEKEVPSVATAFLLTARCLPCRSPTSVVNCTPRTRLE